jgi:hypothetical protein
MHLTKSNCAGQTAMTLAGTIVSVAAHVMLLIKINVLYKLL